MSMQNPPHPGEIIKEFCVEPLHLTVTKAAESLGVTRKTFYFCNARRKVFCRMG